MGLESVNKIIKDIENNNIYMSYTEFYKVSNKELDTELLLIKLAHNVEELRKNKSKVRYKSSRLRFI